MDTIIEILQNTATSTIIDIIALIISIISLFITGCTMKSAKKIQEEMEKMKVNALDKSRFMIYKTKVINVINKKINATKNAQTLSANACMDIAQIIVETKGYESILKVDDYKYICNLHEKIKKLCIKQGAYDRVDISNYIEMLTELKNIFEKGDYML